MYLNSSASESSIHMNTEPPRGYTDLPQSLKPSVFLLLLYYKRVSTGLLPGACCGIVSDSHVRSEVRTGYLKMVTEPSGAIPHS
jgi:hypothetical protein